MSAFAVAFAFVVTAPPLAGPLANAGPPASSAAYVALQPCRLADTRLGTGFTREDPLTILVSTKDVCGVPAGATALALTLTTVDPVAEGFLAAWPANQERPNASAVNFTAHQVRTNGSITRVDAGGAFRIYTSATANVVVDVVGAFVPATSARAGRFLPVAPTRIYDSRSGAKYGPGASFTLPLPGGMPADAVALALNVTITQSYGPGFVTEFPAGRPMPNSSILNVDLAGETRAVAGIFPVSASGMSLYVSGGGHVIVDVLGYFTGPSAAASGEGLFTAYDPQRLLDTRGASSLGNGVPLYPNGGLELATARGGSIAYNVTSVNGDTGFVTAFPAGTVRPTTSTVNMVGGSDVAANFAITQVSGRGLGLFSQSTTHVVVDLEGWFSGASATATQGPPSNTPPVTPPISSQASVSPCTFEGMSTINARRASSGMPALMTSTPAEIAACAWALKMAQTKVMSHSDSSTRDALIGCGSGENVAFASGTSSATLFSMWFASPPHLANILGGQYVGAGNAFVIRTETDGSTTIWGVTELTLC